MKLDCRLDAYAELIGRYGRNSVSLEHANMVNIGSADGYCRTVKVMATRPYYIRATSCH